MALSLAARSRWILAAVFLAGIALLAWRLPRHAPQYEAAYVGEHTAVLWSTTAQVRQPVSTLHYGQRVLIVRRLPDETEVRTEAGLQGWIDARLLMDAALWQQSADLLRQSRALPVQATGRTRTFSNVHLDPGRDAPRIFQFGRGVPVVILERRTVEVPVAGESATAQESAPAAEDSKPPDKPENKPETKPETNEDWLFVSRVTQAPTTGDTTIAPGSSPSAASSASSGAPSASPVSPENPDAAEPSSAVADATLADTPIAGWVLARFIELTPPEPIPDYSSAAGMRVVTWVQLNTVADASSQKPQYLVAGTRGGEGQPCDFTLLRAYTWGAARQRYETAFVEDNLCGRLPIRVREDAGDVEFRFAEAGSPATERVYRMKQTVIRLVAGGTSSRGKRR